MYTCIAPLHISMFLSFFAVPQIMVLGPPAAGKRSISKMVSGKLRATHLTPENLVKEADLKLRDQVEEYIRDNVVCVIQNINFSFVYLFSCLFLFLFFCFFF